ncbi:MAG TPA: T9SS type A sorting domain-containing protein, partial [Bacteroidia bacterium]
TKIDSIINHNLATKKIVIGGTSAGMAIQGGFYFSAQNGSVTTAEALNDPYNVYMTVDSASFLKNKYLGNVITDTHYDDPDRRGRHVTFLARILKDWGIDAKGIACDEYTAVCIDTLGLARCYGDYPAYDEDIYFLQTNCELTQNGPENCSAGNELNWNRNGQAVKVYRVKGTQNGSNTFNLVDWKTGSGGTWEHWYVSNGVFQTGSGTEPNCTLVSLSENSLSAARLYPNPVSDGVLTLELTSDEQVDITIYDVQGKQLKFWKGNRAPVFSINVSAFEPGFYFVELKTGTGSAIQKMIIK